MMGWMTGVCGWMLTLVGTLALLRGSHVLEAALMEEKEPEELEEELEELWRFKTCRYPSFSTFLFRVEFQWFLMELSVLQTKREAASGPGNKSDTLHANISTSVSKPVAFSHRNLLTVSSPHVLLSLSVLNSRCSHAAAHLRLTLTPAKHYF